MQQQNDDEAFDKMEIKMSSDSAPLNGPSVNTSLAFSAAQRAKRRQYLVGALVGLGALFLLVVGLVVSRNGGASREEAKDGVNDVWGELPADVQQMIDRKVNPCDDFYQFSCGQWIKNADIPGEKTAVYASFSKVEDQNELVLKEIMDENLPYVGDLYNTCMNTTAIDALGVAPLRDTLKRIAETISKNALFRLAGELSRTGGPDFLTALAVQADAKDATAYLLYASQSGLALPDPQYYLDSKRWDDLAKPYEEFISQLLALAGWKEADAEADAKLIISFEQALAKIFTPKEELMDPVKTYNAVKLTDAMRSYPLLLGEFLSGTAVPTTVAANARAVEAQRELVSVETPAFFAEAEKLMLTTSLATLKAVLAYQVLVGAASSLSEPFVQASFDFFARRVGGQRERAPRWKVCLHRVVSAFPQLMSKYFAMKTFDLASETAAKDLVARLEKAMLALLDDDVPWLDAETRAAAKAKMARVANLIGHSTRPERLPFVLSNDASYWANRQVVAAARFNRSVLRIGTSVDRDEWFMAASEVNAYYNPAANQIVFPAGILQSPFFARRRHPSQNYGAIGSIIGHEITHAFDDNGRYYDGAGNLVDWWRDDTDAAFRARTTCLVRQFSAFPVVSAIDETTVLGYVNGNYTLGENIADQGGVKLAFRALQDFLFDRSEEEELRDPQTMSRDAAERLFFLSFAQAFCARTTDEAMTRRLHTDPHSPERWRVNGVMKNSPDFARVFECPVGSAMVPETRCTVW
ncbi:hypothetical protein ATCC90586_008018 [Pythium insidiosum]|nr:hypothetical protein ATCC90586_008018 [Pythium insidiosum]